MNFMKSVQDNKGVRLSRKQKNAIELLAAKQVMLMSDFKEAGFYPTLIGNLYRKGIFEIADNSIFKYKLSELGKTIQL